MRSATVLVAAAAIVAPVFAQTSTNCDPTKKSCPPDPALGKSVFYDFTTGSSVDFTVSTGAAPSFDKNGAVFSIASKGQSPTMSSNWFMMFGHYDVVMKPAPGAGIVSSLVLQSDDLDEVDWEWVGNQPDTVQSNYYGRGNTDTYDRGANLSNPAAQDAFHTYSIDWTAEALTWSIDGKTLRTLTPQTADQVPFNQFPQSPMQLKIGSWPAGDAKAKGTSDWAGGPVDWSKAPFDMIVKSVKAIDYSTGIEYSYGAGSDGTWKTIKSKGGQIKSSGDKNAVAVTASAGGPVSSSSLSMAGGVISATTTLASSAINPIVTAVNPIVTAVNPTVTGSYTSGSNDGGSNGTFTSSSPSPSSSSGSKADAGPTGSSGSSTNSGTAPKPSSGASSLQSAASMALAAAVVAALAL